MNINFIATTHNFEKNERLGMISSSYFKNIKQLKVVPIKLLKFIDPYDNTFFNKKQLIQIKKEIEYLEDCPQYQSNELHILKYVVEFVLNEAAYDYLWFMGD